MFRIRLEGFNPTSAFHDAVRDACADVERLSALAQQVTRPRTRQSLADWFENADDGEIWANIGRLDRVIRDSSRTVTFVNGVGKVIRVDYNPHNIAQPPTLPAVEPTVADMNGTAAWVYPTMTRSGTGSRHITDATPLAHTGSGMRLYLGYATVMAAHIDHDELVQTIYHELSHKVIGTNDHVYGYNESKALPLHQKKRNADNYGYFLLEVDD